MKTKSTQVLIVRIILFILLCLYSFIVFGQSDNLQKGKLNSSITLRPDKATVSNLNNFNGIVTEEKTKLQWTLATGNNVSTIVIEKGHKGNAFQACAEFWVNFDGNNETNFQFADKRRSNDTKTYYRLKIIDANGKVEYSKSLHFISQK